MSDLPEDLVDEILCRVPATSLKRLRFTCKRWNRLFTDMKFTRKHFHKAPKETMSLMLKKLGFYSMSINLHRDPTLEITNEFNLINVPHPSLDQFRISPYCHSSDGLLLCVCVNNNKEENIRRLVVWNPCTGQTNWIHLRNRCLTINTFAIGSYQDKKSGIKRYKILRHKYYNQAELEIYEINSDSWRVLDVTMDCNLVYYWRSMISLKGKTYWVSRDEKEKQLGMFLVSFDYTTERFERLCLPYHFPSYGDMSLSVVREEKLSVLLQGECTSKTEIWVTNKIVDETKTVSWIKVLAVDSMKLHYVGNFLIDVEKKVLVYTQYISQKKIYVVAEDNKVREVDFGDEVTPFLFSYVPSLTQIQ